MFHEIVCVCMDDVTAGFVSYDLSDLCEEYRMQADDQDKDVILPKSVGSRVHLLFQGSFIVSGFIYCSRVHLLFQGSFIARFQGSFIARNQEHKLGFMVKLDGLDVIKKKMIEDALIQHYNPRRLVPEDGFM